jgi:hypothetical protein
MIDSLLLLDEVRYKGQLFLSPLRRTNLNLDRFRLLTGMQRNAFVDFI